MKIAFFTFICLASFLQPAFGQGEVFFANRIPGSIDARVQLVSMAPEVPGDLGFADSRFNADLAVLRNGIWESVPGSVTPFRGTPGNAANGYIIGFNIAIPGFAPGATVSLMMRGFGGPSFDGPQTGPVAGQGESSPVQVTLGGGIIPVPNLDGLAPWNLAVVKVPEPSIIALIVLGALVVLLRRNHTARFSS